MTVGKTFEKRGASRKPKRTVKELANEFGISCQKLSGLLSKEGAPKACLRSRSCDVVSATWFDPDEVRKWFQGLPK